MIQSIIDFVKMVMTIYVIVGLLSLFSVANIFNVVFT